MGFGDVGFCGGRKIGEHEEKSPQIKGRTNNKLNPQMKPGWNQSWVTLVGSECSHHCAIPTP